MGHLGCKLNIIPDTGPMLEPCTCPRQHISLGPLEGANGWRRFAAGLYLPFFMNPVTYGDGGDLCWVLHINQSHHPLGGGDASHIVSCAATIGIIKMKIAPSGPAQSN